MASWKAPDEGRAWTAAVQRVGFLGLLLLTWALAARYGPWHSSLFPGPAEVARSFALMARDGTLARAVTRSLLRLFQGYGLSVLIGVPLGIATARVPALRRTIKPVVMGLQSLPSICWLPLAILWFGLSEAAILFVVVMGSLLSVAISTEDGVSSIQPQLLQVSGTLGIRGVRFFTGVLIPAALPGIVTGLKLGWSFAWRALMAGELLFVSGGLGQLLTTARELLDVARVMAVMVAIVVIGVVMDRVIFQAVEVRVRRRWGLETT
ncbi:MAG TPA: ABC transporter permease [Myxococcales bacterium]|nr:ABC transporter permease [Myxococcales bacterium]